MLAIQIITLFVAAPLAATRVMPVEVVDLSRLGLAAAAVLLVTRTTRSALVVLAAFLASALLSSVVRSGATATALALERNAAAGAFDIAILTVVARSVFSGGQVNIHRIMGAVIVYLSIGLVFASAYRACGLLLHPSFSGLPSSAGGPSQMLYFSLSTLTTTGYGDITPLHPFVRSLANLEAVIGQLFPATLLARLVSLHVATKQPPEDR